jgi:hypothetical protein
MESKKRFLLILVAAGALMVGCGKDTAVVQDELYEVFCRPPAQARPFVRWWWNGSCITEKEILRELDLMKDAGIGGVEINVIAMPAGSTKTQDKALTWLSPQWNHIVKFTVDAARQRGILTDIIVGSGWPFGGKFLESGETIQGVALNKKELQGPGVFNGDIKTLMVPPKADRQGQNASEPRLMFLKLVPGNASGIDTSIDMLEKVKPDGKVQLDIPAGGHTLYIGTWQESFKDVVHGAPGADGPVLDHYNGSAVQKYLQRMSETLAPALGGKLGDGFRAIFCDSIELSGANWTTGFAEQFEKRRGYSLAPYLPFVLDETNGQSSRFDEIIRRARYDFYKTIVELFHENFVASFQQWCNRNGAASRFQSEGYPRVLEMLDGYLVTDIPEGEIWLDRHHPDMEMELDRIRYEVFNKYASSGAHLTGKRLISSEAMTNVTAVFRATLEYIKQTSDLSFITGVNHLVLHGFNYSPPEAGFPGWVRYGTYFSEQNPWWPYFKQWADYNSRLSWVFQQTQPQANVAIFGPTAEVWSRHGLQRAPLFITPWYLHLLWQAVHQNGYCADYVNPTVLETATFDDGKLRFGPMAYEVLMVAGVAAMEPATAAAIQRYSKAGGKIVFIGKSPDRSPGLANAAEKDRAVRAAIGAALKSGHNRVALVAEPQKDNLPEWAGATLEKFNVKPYVKILEPDERLFQIHHRLGNRDLFFFANSNRDKAVSFRAGFDTGDKTAWRWEPQTGVRTVFPYAGNKNELDIHLRPLESLLLVFEPEMDGEPQYKAVIDYEDYVEVKTAWQVKLNPVQGRSFEREMTELIDFAGVPQLSTFAGTAVYRTEFDAADTERAMLSLGKVYGVSELKLNGKDLGCRWYGEHVYDVSGVLRPGKNVLEVKLATVLFNYCHSLKNNPTARRWAGRGEPVSVGLLGPVRLLGSK